MPALRSDWSRTKFQMSASRLVNVSEELINATGENSVAKSTKDASGFGGKLFKKIDRELLLME